MTTTLAFLTIFGATLGLRCTVRALGLASIACVAVLSAASIAAGPLAVAVQVVTGLVALQAGYFAGMLLHATGHAGAPVRPEEAAAPDGSGRPVAARIEGPRPV